MGGTAEPSKRANGLGATEIAYPRVRRSIPLSNPDWSRGKEGLGPPTPKVPFREQKKRRHSLLGEIGLGEEYAGGGKSVLYFSFEREKGLIQNPVAWTDGFVLPGTPRHGYNKTYVKRWGHLPGKRGTLGIQSSIHEES